eukprot:1442617-Prymnesium_polylepis.2
MLVLTPSVGDAVWASPRAWVLQSPPHSSRDPSDYCTCRRRSSGRVDEKYPRQPKRIVRPRRACPYTVLGPFCLGLCMCSSLPQNNARSALRPVHLSVRPTHANLQGPLPFPLPNLQVHVTKFDDGFIEAD